MEIKQKKYKNGLRLVAAKTNSKVVAINILFNVGSQNESYDQEGYAHFIEHLMFKGSNNFSAEELMDKFTFLGSDYNAYTTRTATRYTFKCLKENFEECFKIYADMFISASFDSDEIDKERSVVIEEMKKCDDDPVEVLYRTTMQNYFNGYSFAHDELGREEIIKNVTREELLEFKNKYYKPENCLISVAGDISFDEVDRIINEYYSSNYDYESDGYNLNKNEIVPSIKNKYDIVERKDNQVNVCLHIKTVTLESDLKYVSDIYTSILGNSQNSRLFKILREKLGLVYSVYAFNDMRMNSGEVYIIFGTRAQNVKQAIKVIKTEMENLSKNGITDIELQRAKNWKESCVAFGIESSAEIAELNGSYTHYFGKPTSAEEKIQNYRVVTKEQVDEFAKKIYVEDVFNIVAVGQNIKLDDLKQF